MQSGEVRQDKGFELVPLEVGHEARFGKMDGPAGLDGIHVGGATHAGGGAGVTGN